MATKSTKTVKSTTGVLQLQKQYVERLAKEKFRYGLAVGTAFVSGMRNVGYRNSATAIDDLVDNSIEAASENVHVVLHDDGSGRQGSGRQGSVTQIAVIDDGCGMIPEMIRVSVLWGGTHRENSRTGSGRFGYGLPSASVSQGKRFEVYSQPEGGDLHMTAVDLQEIEEGKFTNREGEIVVPEAKPAKLPRFVQDYIDEHMDGKWSKGTVVVIDKLDKNTWKAINTFRNHLLEHFGVAYHKLRANVSMYVNGTFVDPIDPLFLTPGYRWFDLDADRATALDPMLVDIKDAISRDVIGRITVRMSYMPETFASTDKSRGATGRNQNPRFSILKNYNGFIVSRMGRVLDLVTRNDWTTFVNYDRFFKIEIDFDATLDEFMTVPTTKQTVTISEKVWEALEGEGLRKAMEQMRKEVKAARQQKDATGDATSDGKRASEAAMEQSALVSTPLTAERMEKQKEVGRDRLLKKAQSIAAETGKPVKQVEREIEAELAGKCYKVSLRSVPGGTFFEVEQLGATKVLWLNKASRFFKDVYAGSASSPAVRASLEILLFSIGDRMLEGTDALKAMYAHEVPEWSKKMEFALAHLANALAVSPGEEEGEMEEITPDSYLPAGDEATESLTTVS